MFDRGQRRRAGPAIVAANEHDVGVRLGDSRRHGADADFGDELDADASVPGGVLEVVNKFREVLNRINVVMRRWRDEADTRRRGTDFRNPRVNLLAGQFTTLTGFRALRHLDLELPSVD